MFLKKSNTNTEYTTMCLILPIPYIHTQALQLLLHLYVYLESETSRYWGWDKQFRLAVGMHIFYFPQTGVFTFATVS